MKKYCITGIILTLLMILAIPAATVYAEGKALYLKTAAIPEAASEYADKMFSSFTKSDLTSLGLTSSEAKGAILANGFCAKAADENVNTENTFYFPILYDGEAVALMTVTYNGIAYGYQLGKDDMVTALNSLTTSYDNAVEIYVSRSAFYGVTDDDVTVLSYGLSYKESTIKKEIASLKNKRKSNGSQTDIIVVYGNTDDGFVKKDGKLYYMRSDGSYATGWQTINGNKYYFRKTGEAVNKNTVIGKIRYKFDANGICQGTYTGWVKKSGKYYYYKNGEMRTNCWINVKGVKTYYLTEDGSRATGEAIIDGKTYVFSDNGKLTNQ